MIACTLISKAIFPQLEAVAVNADDSSVKFPIIMYHGLLKDPTMQGEFVISPDLFEEDLKEITSRGYTTILVQDLINYVEQNIPLPEKPIMLAFDDGNYNNYIYALPLLKKYNCKMVLSPIAYFVDQYSESLDLSATYSTCTWDNLREMHESGLVEMQNHTYDLHSYTNGRMGIKQKSSESDQEYRSLLIEDITKAQNRFRDKLGYTPKAFSYPFGSYDEKTEDFMKEMGFSASFICYDKLTTITKNKDSLFGLCKILRSNKSNSKSFFEKWCDT